MFLSFLYLNFERASQSPAAGGAQAGDRLQRRHSLHLDKKELADGLWADPVDGVLFLEIGVPQSLYASGSGSSQASHLVLLKLIQSMYVNQPCPVSGHFSGTDTARTAGPIKELLTAIPKVPYVFWTSLGIA